MREDIAKVIVERPRAGRSFLKAAKGTRRFKEWKNLDAPTKMSMLPAQGERKHSTDLLAPLERLVRKSVGRPWDKVYQEICEHLKPNSTMQKHVLDHVKRDLVERDCQFDVNGFPWKSPGRYQMPLSKGELYVDQNGIIAVAKDNWKYRAAHDAAAYDHSKKGDRVLILYGKKFYYRDGNWFSDKNHWNSIDLSFSLDGVNYHMKDGIWFKTWFGQTVTDSRIKNYVDDKPVLEYFTYQISKELQLNSAELRRLKLSNFVEEPVIEKRSQKKDREPYWFKKNT